MNLGIFIRWLLPGGVSYENGAIRFIDNLYPVSDIISRLKKAQDDNVQWRGEHASAIERFWDFYNRESGSPSSPELGEEQAGSSDSP
jgi:hypothetical protein